MSPLHFRDQKDAFLFKDDACCCCTIRFIGFPFVRLALFSPFYSRNLSLRFEAGHTPNAFPNASFSNPDLFKEGAAARSCCKDLEAVNTPGMLPSCRTPPSSPPRTPPGLTHLLYPQRWWWCWGDVIKIQSRTNGCCCCVFEKLRANCFLLVASFRNCSQYKGDLVSHDDTLSSSPCCCSH